MVSRTASLVDELSMVKKDLFSCQENMTQMTKQHQENIKKLRLQMENEKIKEREEQNVKMKNMKKEMEQVSLKCDHNATYEWKRERLILQYIVA